MKNWFSMVLLVVSFSAVAGYCQSEKKYDWPEMSPQRLKEEIFLIRYELALEDGGAKGAEKFLRKALQKDPAPHVKALVAWTTLYKCGMQPIVDIPTAERLANEALAEGSVMAADVLGRAKFFGDAGIAQDKDAGQALVKQAADAGYPRAIGTEGTFYIWGSGRPRDIVRGSLMVRDAAALGSTIALDEIASQVESGQLFGQPNIPVAMDYYFQLAQYNQGYRKLASYVEKGVPNARLLYLLARASAYNEGAGVAPTVARERIKELEQIMTADARAMVEVGVAHLVGYYAKRDDAYAKELLEMAAMTNDDAKLFLAYMKCYGRGMAKDIDGGLAELEALAGKGNARAANWLASIYYWGKGDFPVLKKDEKKALHYIKLAARQGYDYALFNLGFAYEHGIGTAPDYALAAIMHWRAYKAGFLDCKERVMRDLAFVKL